MKVSHCSKFIDVYLLTIKILKSATIGMPALYVFYVEICNNTPKDFHKNKNIQTFCIIACPRSIEISKSR